ncbi:MAG: hypothetical protein JWP81_1427, partial [Ferruginibacter sp.]|nr:hypothetical protein [Ferruginibacter sp.]
MIEVFKTNASDKIQSKVLLC